MERNNTGKLAVQNFVRTVHNLSKLDHCQTDYINTKAIIEGGLITNSTKHDIDVIDNLKKVWSKIINEYENLDLNWETISAFHKIIGENLVLYNGELRKGSVGVYNIVNQPPESLNLADVKEQINAIFQNDDALDMALEYLCFGIKTQLFYDANKRTSFIVANLILIKNNIGLISVAEEQYHEFDNHLKLLFDEGEDGKVEFKNYLKENCIEYTQKIEQAHQ